jgi:hypothetical protein
LTASTRILAAALSGPSGSEFEQIFTRSTALQVTLLRHKDQNKIDKGHQDQFSTPIWSEDDLVQSRSAVIFSFEMGKGFRSPIPDRIDAKTKNCIHFSTKKITGLVHGHVAEMKNKL